MNIARISRLTSSTLNITFNSIRSYSSAEERLSCYNINEAVKVSESGERILHVEINRPKTRNAINTDVFNGLTHVFGKLNDDRHYRVAILSSVGDFFCSGIDLKTFQSFVPTHTEDVGRKALALRSVINMLQDSFKKVSVCQKPVISVVSGGCIGAGLELISLADIRYVTKDSYFTIREVELGLAADLGALQFLPLIMSNQSVLRELTYTGRKISADEALNLNLVGKVLSDKDEAISSAIELATTIASKSPIVVQGAKVGLDYSRDHGVWEGLQFMVHWNMAMLQSEDLIKSAMALMSKSPEPPKFDDL
ncbi:delta(3,5)-Delta(2,4)-dienoyl-CoA isomerase, mitochondrial-like [Tetranychus urticae]|uniref:Enoyl-CoA hydratase n=1 Tax=Tetranychus urticae TaxID=32264 RepID=T1KB88_TETUR|nr:delta(3,5)-Delta(2,4)-dienoyl-CoA isomerase, mitochondrial-like [Tetranychus urticae]